MLTLLVRFTFVALALSRVANLIATERGPFNAFQAFRQQVYKRWPGSTKGESWQFEGITCVLCVSFWLAWPSALLVGPSSVLDWALYSLALAGAVMAIHRMKK